MTKKICFVTTPIFTGPSQYKTGINPERVRQILKEADVNGDNYLSWSELQKAFSKLGSRLPPYRAWRGLKNADANGDGLISSSEKDLLVRYIMDWYNRDAQR